MTRLKKALAGPDAGKKSEPQKQQTRDCKIKTTKTDPIKAQACFAEHVKKYSGLETNSIFQVNESIKTLPSANKQLEMKNKT